MVEFLSDSATLQLTTSDSSLEVPLNLLQGTDLKVIITAFVPDLQLVGIPLSTNLPEGKIVRLIVASIVVNYFCYK